jgi:hypothetical protein
MAFAIFWMVIGELITLHQERIFKVNYYDHSNPFTKPKSKDDGNSFSFKLFKISEKGSYMFDAFTFSDAASDSNLILKSSIIKRTYRAKQAHSFSRIIKKPLRAPPSLG